MDRQARLDADRPDADVTIKDVPAVGLVGIAAAGEGGHALLKRGGDHSANHQYLAI
jgi:hypothetical protein